MTEFTIIYYDLEAYNTGNGSCVNVVHKFLEGFNRHLKNSSRRAGTYGSSGGSGATGWASICCGGVPDQVWLANWNGQVTTQSIPPVPDSYWIYDQRIHQYEGDVTDGPGFGATALNIDKNCLNGMVAGTEHTGVTRQCY